MTEYFVAFVLIVLASSIFGGWKLRKLFWAKARLVSDETAAAIIHAIPDRILLVDRRGVIRAVYNEQADHPFVADGVAAGKSMAECVDPDTAPAVTEAIRTALASDGIVGAEYSMTREGQTLFYEGRFKRVGGDRVICFGRDITARKQRDEVIRQNEKLLTSVLDNMPMPLIIKDIDDDLKYIFWNKPCELQGGYGREVILGKSDIEIYGQERGERYRAVDAAMIAGGEPYQAQEMYVTPDGEKHVSVVHKHVVSDGSHNWLLATRWDVSDLIRTQEQLEEANRQLQIAFSIADMVPVVWDIPGDWVTLKFPEFKKLNRNFYEDRDGADIASVVQFVHPEERGAFVALLEVLKSGSLESGHLEFRYDTHGVYDAWYDCYMAIEKRDESGRPQRVIGVLRSITQRKTHERSLLETKKNVEELQRMNQLILDHSNSGLVYMTPDYYVLWENLSKYSSHPLAANYRAGQCCYQLMDRTSPCPGCVAQRSLESGKREVKEASLPGGTIAEITATPVYAPGDEETVGGLVLKFEDISAQRQAAEALKRAKETAEQSDKLKSLFLSNMSHEIRTPLNAILGFSELLTQTDDLEEKKEYLSIIGHNNELLLQLINDILDLSKIEAGALEFVYGNVDLNELLRNLEMSSRRKSTRPAVEISFVPPAEGLVVRTERNRLLQVLSNLVGNAMKFTDQGSIRFGYECRDGLLHFFVSDTGKGIPAERQAEIFQRFVKLDDFSNGTGLGLAICQNIVHKLGGTIGVESELGKGTVFRFSIPCLSAADEA